MSDDPQMIPIHKIHVLNPRARNKVKFREIAANITEIGLKAAHHGVPAARLRR